MTIFIHHAVYYTIQKDSTQSETEKYALKDKTQGFSGSVGMGILWGFPQIFLWVIGMGIEIQFPRHPCLPTIV